MATWTPVLRHAAGLVEQGACMALVQRPGHANPGAPTPPSPPRPPVAPISAAVGPSASATGAARDDPVRSASGPLSLGGLRLSLLRAVRSSSSGGTLAPDPSDATTSTSPQPLPTTPITAAAAAAAQEEDGPATAPASPSPGPLAVPVSTDAGRRRSGLGLLARTASASSLPSPPVSTLPAAPAATAAPSPALPSSGAAAANQAVLQAFQQDVQSRFWFTYRRDFDRIEPSYFTTDVGWGCMLRTGQMLLAQAFGSLLLTRGTVGMTPFRQHSQKTLRHKRMQGHSDIHAKRDGNTRSFTC
jgi:hypothetical protein